MATTVLLVDDHRPFRSALRALLEVDARLQIVGEAADGAEAVRLAQDLAPDVIVMDVSMPGLSGLEATQEIVAARPDAIVIGLTMHADPTVHEAMRAAGARLSLAKGGDASAISFAIHSLAGAPGTQSPTSLEAGGGGGGTGTRA